MPEKCFCGGLSCSEKSMRVVRDAVLRDLRGEQCRSVSVCDGFDPVRYYEENRDIPEAFFGFAVFYYRAADARRAISDDRRAGVSAALEIAECGISAAQEIAGALLPRDVLCAEALDREKISHIYAHTRLMRGCLVDGDCLERADCEKIALWMWLQLLEQTAELRRELRMLQRMPVADVPARSRMFCLDGGKPVATDIGGVFEIRNTPTMSLDEFVDREIQRGNIVLPPAVPPKPSREEKEKEQEVPEEKILKRLRRHDLFRDEHRYGSGRQ